MGVDTTTQQTFMFHLRQLGVYRELLQNLIKRDIKAQTKQSLLGYLWIFLPPLFQMGIFTLLFQGILGIQMTERVPYAVFLYCTALPWQMFANMVTQGTMCVVGHGTLVKQVYFPKEVVILSSMITEGFKTLIASIILIGLMIFYKISVGINLLWLPLLIGIQFFFSLGLTLPLSLFNAFARDISKGIGIFLSLWMYITPVVYPLEKVPEAYRGLYLLNPMAVLIQGYRQVILENSSPEILRVVFLVFTSVLIFIIGYSVFKKAEAFLADII
jgi:ABC-2 type transport system permease protein